MNNNHFMGMLRQLAAFIHCEWIKCQDCAMSGLTREKGTSGIIKCKTCLGGCYVLKSTRMKMD
jgi:hypothetical protein